MIATGAGREDLRSLGDVVGGEAGPQGAGGASGAAAAAAVGVDAEEGEDGEESSRPIRVAVSRLGSGSHLMAYLLALRERWPTQRLSFVVREKGCLYVPYAALPQLPPLLLLLLLAGHA
jgi:hypothetical protein